MLLYLADFVSLLYSDLRNSVFVTRTNAVVESPGIFVSEFDFESTCIIEFQLNNSSNQYTKLIKLHGGNSMEFYGHVALSLHTTELDAKSFRSSPEQFSLSLTRSLKLFITQMHDCGFSRIQNVYMHRPGGSVFLYINFFGRTFAFAVIHCPCIFEI